MNTEDQFGKDFIMMGVLALLAGLCTRVVFHFVEQESILPINFLFTIVPFIAVYFVYKNKADKKILAVLGAAFLLLGIYSNTLTDMEKDSTIMVYLHLPVFLWMILGLAFTGNQHASGSKRLIYLKLNGEFGILYTIMAIGGMVLTVLTIQLFSILELDIAEFYFKNVILIGIAALAVVASYLVMADLKLSKTIAPYMAKIFSPLVLVTLVSFLATVAWTGKNPFVDRNFLIAFNGILLFVLVVTIFSITERGGEAKKGIFDIINFALIGVTFIVDTIALMAIVFRLTSFGITPNRIAVTGVNLLIWGNLLLIIMSYFKFLQNRADATTIQDAVTKYLPVYGMWAALVIVFFPILFK